MSLFDDIAALEAELAALRSELEAKGVLSPPAPAFAWTLASIANGILPLLVAHPIVRAALMVGTPIVSSFVAENPHLFATSRDDTPITDTATLEMLSRGIMGHSEQYLGPNRYTDYGGIYTLSPVLVQALFESDHSRVLAQAIFDELLSHFQDPEIQQFINEELADIDSRDALAAVAASGNQRFSIVDGQQIDWRILAPALSFLRRLSAGEVFSGEDHVLAEAAMFLGPEFANLNLMNGLNVDPTSLARFARTMYPSEFEFLGVPSVPALPSTYPELYHLFERWVILDGGNQSDLLSLIGMLQPVLGILDADYLPPSHGWEVDENGVPYLLQGLASSPYLLEQLAAAQGGDHSLLAEVMSNPSWITALSTSPIFTQVLSEMFANEDLQQLFAQELFGDIEEADNPIRAAIASAFGDLADADNPIAQQLVQGVLGAVDPENPGSSLGGAVRQVVQDVLDTPETGVIPRLNRLETTLESVNTQLLLVSTGLTRLREELAAMLSSTDRRAEHNPKLPWQPVITEG